MLDNVGLIHMNGRVYDPALGRFLSVDPVFQFPTNTQSLNPYSYVRNSPLSATDPTGFIEGESGAVIEQTPGAEQAAKAAPENGEGESGSGVSMPDAPDTSVTVTATQRTPTSQMSIAGGSSVVMPRGDVTNSERQSGFQDNGAPLSPEDLGSLSNRDEHIGGSGIKKSGFVQDKDGNIVNSTEVEGSFIDAPSTQVTSATGAIRGKDAQGNDLLHAGKDAVPLNTDGTVCTTCSATSGTKGTLLAKDVSGTGYGKHVVAIRTPDGNQVIYGHLESVSAEIMKLKVGDEVPLGTKIGIIGNEGTPDASQTTKGVHLHTEMRVGDKLFEGQRLGVP